MAWGAGGGGSITLPAMFLLCYLWYRGSQGGCCPLKAFTALCSTLVAHSALAVSEGQWPPMHWPATRGRWSLCMCVSVSRLEQ